jgi:hypothetical protein
MVPAVAADVSLVSSEGYEIHGQFLYRGELPDPGQEIDVEDELATAEVLRRARVIRVTQEDDGPRIYAFELEP